MRETLKHCGHCGKDKMPGAFHKDANRWDGRHPMCKLCRRNQRLKYGVPALVKVGGRCSVCGSTHKVYKDMEQKHGRLCGKCLTMLRLVSRDTSHLDRLADYLDGKPSF